MHLTAFTLATQIALPDGYQIINDTANQQILLQALPAVPEPSSLLLLGCGILMISKRASKKQNRSQA